jgi:hypothetical protein
MKRSSNQEQDAGVLIQLLTLPEWDQHDLSELSRKLQLPENQASRTLRKPDDWVQFIANAVLVEKRATISVLIKHVKRSYLDHFATVVMNLPGTAKKYKVDELRKIVAEFITEKEEDKHSRVLIERNRGDTVVYEQKMETGFQLLKLPGFDEFSKVWNNDSGLQLQENNAMALEFLAVFDHDFNSNHIDSLLPLIFEHCDFEASENVFKQFLKANSDQDAVKILRQIHDSGYSWKRTAYQGHADIFGQVRIMAFGEAYLKGSPHGCYTQIFILKRHPQFNTYLISQASIVLGISPSLH